MAQCGLAPPAVLSATAKDARAPTPPPTASPVTTCASSLMAEHNGCGSARTAACRSSRTAGSRAGPNATAFRATASARCISIATGSCGSARTTAAWDDFRTADSPQSPSEAASSTTECSRFSKTTHGTFWMTSNRGIHRVAKEQLNAFAAGTLSAVSSSSYGKSDGMLNEECNGGIWPAGIRARDGRLWLPTQDGVAVIDPKEVAANTRPPTVRIESGVLDGAPVPTDRTVRILPGQENLEIRYTGLTFINAERMVFRYRLHGVDRDWVYAGTRRARALRAYPSRPLCLQRPCGQQRWRLDRRAGNTGRRRLATLLANLELSRQRRRGSAGVGSIYVSPAHDTSASRDRRASRPSPGN